MNLVIEVLFYTNNCCLHRESTNATTITFLHKLIIFLTSNNAPRPELTTVNASCDCQYSVIYLQFITTNKNNKDLRKL